MVPAGVMRDLEKIQMPLIGPCDEADVESDLSSSEHAGPEIQRPAEAQHLSREAKPSGLHSVIRFGQINNSCSRKPA